MEVRRLRTLALEIPNRNTVQLGDKSIRSLGPHIWNGLPEEIKNETSYDKFKEYSNTCMDQNVPAACVPSLK